MTVLRAPSSRHPRPVRRRAPLALAALLVGSLAWGAPAAAGPSPSPSPEPPGPPPARSVSMGSGAQRTVALTFDDGWDAERCLAIADTLDRYRIPATFFPNGVYVVRDQAAWRSIGARFPVGNHTYHHMDLRTLDEKRIARELERNRKLVEDVTGRPMAPFLRPPYGDWNARVARVAGALGYRHIVLWSNTDADTAPHITPRGAALSALRGDPGAIVLLHCGPEVTPAVLPVIIERYACDGFRFVTVGELLAGSAGHKAKVDCPPLPLPEKNRPDRPTGSPEPSPLPSPMASPEPSASAGLLPSASPSPSASPEPPVDPLCIRVVSAITGHLAGLIDALIALLPPPSAPPSVPPSGTP